MEVAREAHCTSVTVSRYANGEVGTVKPDTLKKICDALDLDADALLNAQEDPRDKERVVVTMTREQARAVMQATELLARLHIGQVFTIPELLGNLAADDYCDRRDRSNEAFKLGIKLLLGTNIYGQPDVETKNIWHQRCWAVYATIRHALAWHDNPEGNMWSVAFDKPMPYGEPMPKCEIETTMEEE